MKKNVSVRQFTVNDSRISCGQIVNKSTLDAFLKVVQFYPQVGTRLFQTGKSTITICI